MEITAQSRMAIADAIQMVFTNLNNLTRWPQLTADRRYNQLNKLSLGMIISFCIAKIVEKEGTPIEWGKFPKLAIKKALEKATLANTPKSQILWLKEKANINDVANQATKKQFSKLPEKVWSFLETSPCLENEIFRLSGKFASLMEIDELVPIGARKRYLETYTSKNEEIKEYTLLTDSISSEWKKLEPVLSESITGLRNQSRWILYSRTVECSILSHLFETAVIAYIMALELGYGEEVATRYLFMSLLHDLAETWTFDMPSPLKDCMPGLRKATEEYEDYMMKKNMYSEIPEYLADAFKALDFESEENKMYKPLVKGADYVSASLECIRQYWGGTRDPRFHEAVQNIKNMADTNRIKVSSIGHYIIQKANRALSQL